MKKKILILLLIIFVVVTVAAVTGWLLYSNARVDYNRMLDGAVSSPVIITRDGAGVPHIEAASREDFLSALGFVHAQDRQSSIEYFRALALGRTSMVSDDDAELLERLSNAIGFSRYAAEITAALSPGEIGQLEAYARGINIFRMNDASRVGLDDPWQPRDVVAMLLLRQWASNFLENHEYGLALPDQGITWQTWDLFPRNRTRLYSPEEQELLDDLRTLADVVTRHIGTFNYGFAMSVPTEEDSMAMVYNFSSPLGHYPDWYPLSATIGSDSYSFVSVAGMPFMAMAHSEALQYVTLLLAVDVQEVVRYRTRLNEDVLQYYSRYRWNDFSVIRDTDGDGDLVWTTEEGPLLEDILGKERKSLSSGVTALTFSHGDASQVSMLLSMPFLSDERDVASLLRNVNSPPRAFLVASKGKASLYLAGQMPADVPANRIARDGALYRAPAVRNIYYSPYVNYSPRVYVASDVALPLENNSQARFNRYKARRLETLEPCGTGDCLKALSLDTVSSFASELMGPVNTILQPNPVTSARLARIYFKSWDFRMDKDLVSPVIFHELLKNMVYETLADDFPDVIDSLVAHYQELAPGLMELASARSMAYFDDTTTEEIERPEEIFDRAFLRTMRQLNRRAGPIMDDWTWGAFHRGSFDFQMNRHPVITRMLHPVEDRPYSGSSTTVHCSVAGADFVPSCVTVLSGYHSGKESAFLMEYGYSLHPMSEFYHGREEEYRWRPFTPHQPLMRIVIQPKGGATGKTK